MKNRFWQIITILMVAALVLAACAQPTAAPTQPPASAGGSFLDRAFAGEFKGTVGGHNGRPLHRQRCGQV
jgi:ABC-type glycerol-3-phosphate transport system substrate-binding protein